MLCKFETIMIFFNFNLSSFLVFFFKKFFFSNWNFTFYDLRLLSEKFTFFINYIVILFTIYEFYKKLRLFKNI